MDTSVETFHNNCKKSWKSYNNCPVCYNMKNPDLIQHLACMQCDTKDTLWFCIICGHVGCGHKVQRHALEHYQETKHRYVMGLEGFKVWDYKIKKFVHQLEANNTRCVKFHIITNETNAENSCSCALCQHNRSSKLLKNPICMTCEESHGQNLWICLSCRHIGCGRNKKRHALQHYRKTNHPHVMQLENFSIWDYNEKKYLHAQVRYSVAIRLHHQLLE